MNGSFHKKSFKLVSFKCRCGKVVKGVSESHLRKVLSQHRGSKLHKAFMRGRKK